MTILLLIGIILNFVSYRWMTHHRREQSGELLSVKYRDRHIS